MKNKIQNKPLLVISTINNPKNNTVSQKKSNAFNKGNQNVIQGRYFDPNKDLIKGKFAQYHY